MGLLQSLKKAAHFPSEAEAMASLDESGIRANQNLVYSVIWELREEWRLAFLAFKWGDKWGCVDEKACELMVWVLGNHRKFNTAWILIRDLHRSLMSTRKAMLIMIDRYAAANVPGKAIYAFRIMDKFRMTPDEEAFYFLLNVLCKNGNIEEAEEFMLVNKKFFPLEVEGFNIILNGWCNICVDIFEAKRIWREMSKYCIDPDATTYTHMISCFSKVGNLFDSLRLYDGMKKRGWVPGIEVYNSLVYVLTRENCLKEALKILDKMKETGLQRDSATYNSMIRPLCEAKKLEDARSLMAAMIEENVSPTIETYHAFLQGIVFEETFEVLDRMKIAGLGPTEDTFLLLLAKFFKLEQPENALKIWVEMKQYEVASNLTHYTVMVEGLARCGLLTKAREYYAEMRSNGYSDDPKIQKMLKVPVQDKNDKRKKLGGQFKRNQHILEDFSKGGRREIFLHGEFVFDKCIGYKTSEVLFPTFNSSFHTYVEGSFDEAQILCMTGFDPWRSKISSTFSYVKEKKVAENQTSHCEMVSRLIFFCFCILFSAIATTATDHIVGANKGWNPGINYTHWANNHTFYVGDLISFRYQKTQYNVFEVNQTGYDNCTTEGAVGNWTSGKDFIPLNKAKRYYFIGGNGQCFNGMKVTILVHPLPTPPTSATMAADVKSSDSAASLVFHKGLVGLRALVLAVASIWFGSGWI
ncbi:hypothetical protein D5086_000379 [Populus alba]|uniref:Uncharacterized protein n=1 Tax=Populus alba TaxID=43335 RepID=A0ACC4CW77_POPAL